MQKIHWIPRGEMNTNTYGSSFTALSYFNLQIITRPIKRKLFPLTSVLVKLTYCVPFINSRKQLKRIYPFSNMQTEFVATVNCRHPEIAPQHYLWVLNLGSVLI